jgi:tRNA 2-thiouridine synthesizing protein A
MSRDLTYFYGTEMITKEEDARGLKCPLPILRAKKALAQLESGDVLKILTTDQHAIADFQAFCQQTGNTLISYEEVNQEINFIIQRR